MNRTTRFIVCLLAVSLLGGLLWVALAAPRDRPAADSVTVTLCDGKTEMTVPGLKPGEKLDRAHARQVAGLFLNQWKRNNPGRTWLLAQNRPPAQPKPARQPAPAKKQSEIYSRFTPRDELIWKIETEKFIAEGNRIFHDADAFGGTIGVSCDMCHPDASNTHPETYPKYQVQLQRVALLRDMINWCIQHPAKGAPLADEDPRLRAMEAYILAQRKGKPIEPGKH